jgi:hypothetical protein
VKGGIVNAVDVSLKTDGNDRSIESIGRSIKMAEPEGPATCWVMGNAYEVSVSTKQENAATKTAFAGFAFPKWNGLRWNLAKG